MIDRFCATFYGGFQQRARKYMDLLEYRDATLFPAVEFLLEFRPCRWLGILLLAPLWSEVVERVLGHQLH